MDIASDAEAAPAVNDTTETKAASASKITLQGEYDCVQMFMV